MQDAADKTETLVEPVTLIYRFNKVASISKAAGFLVFATGYVVRSVLGGFEGERTVSNVVGSVPTLTVLVYAAVILCLLGALLMAIFKPANQLQIDGTNLEFQTGGTTARLPMDSIVAIAPFERKGRGFAGRRTPRRSIAILANDGTNLVAAPTGVRWKSTIDAETTLDDDLLDHPSMVIPLHGMPNETEDELRGSLPNWI